MKTKLLIVFALLSPQTQLFGATSPLSSPEMLTLIDLYKQVMDLDDLEYLFIQWSTLPKTEGNCTIEKNFESIEANDLKQKVKNNFEQVALEHPQPNSQQLMIQLEQTLDQFLIYQNQYEICSEYSTPAYSDGHEVHYVKINGELIFSFELGRPD